MSLSIFCTHSQEDTTTIRVNREAFKNALKWATYGVECDSLVQIYTVKDSLKEEIIESQHKQIELDQVFIGELQYSNNKLRMMSYGFGGLSAVLLFILITGK